MKGSGMLVPALAILILGCTVGESPPERPVPPGGEAVPETPGEPGPAPGATPDATSAELLGEARAAYDASELEEALELAGRVIAQYGGSAPATEAAWVAARAAFALGRYDEARDLAASYADAQPSRSAEAEAAEAVVELAEDALEEPSSAPPVVGVVLPRSGSRVLVRYADYLLQGIELAVQEVERRQGRPIELVVMDDAGGTLTQAAVEDLERRGALAIIGPLLPQQLAAAAGARRDPALVLVSPTIPESPGWSETYSVNTGDVRAAGELGRYAADAGLTQAAFLYARSREFERKAQAFAAAFEDRGGRIRTMVPYDSGTTTFGSHMEDILAAVRPGARGGMVRLEGDSIWVETQEAGGTGSGTQQPFALFVAAPPQDVPKIAPQVSFYGLDSAGVQVFGDEAWATPQVRRVVPDRDLEGAIVASRFPPERAGASADPEFVRLYEGLYRRSLDNPLPALGYDAANLVLQALPNRRLSPSAVARRFGLLAGIRGATGMLSVRASQVVRTPYLVQIRGGKLAPAPYPWELELPQPGTRVGSGGRGSRR
ncbi:MAG: hypothetical protein GWM90_26895 [Gemmatimonadetes bacterium]|nr:hypothetical protein [Gemmatimonadota bacterium]NIU78759.1 hypothetical protein [Gammaproteobacteria bacterium]NIQ58565.1 hypothetical protein [Gemmatimonadota bacterium]NIW35372.1 hypothetical protein [Gemmatimonadota bacterium]NIX47564.1 hypothetical protein [Gemmatimonadota bacterium]